MFWQRVWGDLWPPDRSAIAPNLVAAAIQWAIVGGVGWAVYPPFRRWIDAHILDRLDRNHERSDRNNQLLHHLIEHLPDVPPAPPKEQP